MKSNFWKASALSEDSEDDPEGDPDGEEIANGIKDGAAILAAWLGSLTVHHAYSCVLSVPFDE